jgi:hypothetical protein
MINKMTRSLFVLTAFVCALALNSAQVSAQDIEVSPLFAPELTESSEGDAPTSMLIQNDIENDSENDTNTIISSDEAAEIEESMESYPAVRLRALDKITARTVSFEVEVGKTVKFGDIYIRPQTCKEPPPIEEPESSAFLQIWEQPEDANAKWIFSGWMFASSPALSAMDHPVYDVWVLDCIEALSAENAQEVTSEELE